MKQKVKCFPVILIIYRYQEVMTLAEKLWISDSRKTTVCIDSYEDGVFRGRFYDSDGTALCFGSLSRFLLMMEDPGQQLTKSLYPAIAEVYGTSTANVEKGLRTTVTTAWQKRRDKVWRAYFPTAPGGQIPKPTAGQFLRRLTDEVLSVSRRRA